MIYGTEEQIRRFQEDTMRFWNGGRDGKAPCIRDWAPSVCLHEIEPRSTYREWFTDPFNSVPVCNKCHQWAHQAGAAGKIELKARVVKRLQQIGEWKPDRIVREIDESRTKDTLSSV